MGAEALPQPGVDALPHPGLVLGAAARGQAAAGLLQLAEAPDHGPEVLQALPLLRAQAQHLRLPGGSIGRGALGVPVQAEQAQRARDLGLRARGGGLVQVTVRLFQVKGRSGGGEFRVVASSAAAGGSKGGLAGLTRAVREDLQLMWPCPGEIAWGNN